MKPLSANAAAKMAGKAKGTILKALEDGTLSGSKNAKGQWEIDPSDLARAFDFTVTDQSDDQSKKPTMTSHSDIENRIEIERLKAELQAERRLTETMAEQVADLRERLDRESQDRRALSAMLTDQRGQGTPVPSRRSFLGLFGARA